MIDDDRPSPPAASTEMQSAPLAEGRSDGPKRTGPSGEKNPQSIGFLTVLQHDEQGLVGGYLLLNPAGRPLEFHCTAPIKPNRAQQILFGPTLQSYLYGEQIGQTLLAKSALEPLVVYTDLEAALSVRDYVSLPMALVIAQADSTPPAAAQTGWRLDAAQQASPHMNCFALGRNNLAVQSARDADRQEIVARSSTLGELDLSEPFARIREAIEEAHKSAR